MDKLEDQMITEIIPKERIQQKYVPLRDELKTVEGQLVKLNRPSVNIDDKKIETIIGFLKQLPKLYEAFNKQERKQFLKWFIQKIWIKNRKIVEVSYTEPFKALLKLDLVRISELWLERWYDYRQTDWSIELEYPEFTTKEVSRFLFNFQ